MVLCAGHGAEGVKVLRDILILGLAVTAQALLTQAPPVPPSERPFQLSTTAELVLLDVSVETAEGEHVWNLKKEDFKVYEDGKLQHITHFASDDVPVTVGLVIDTSGSMRPKYDHMVTAAMAFIKASNRADEVFVVNFGDGVTHGLPDNLPFSSDLAQLRAALATGRPAGRTALHDAMVYSLTHLQKGKCERKALMLVSDGGDNSSTHLEAEVMRMVRESRATIYTIGLFDAEDHDRNPGLLRRLAQMSGGEAFLPESLEQVGNICQQIASDIRTRYTIGYVPVRSGEQGASRKIRVTVATPGGKKLAVHTRTSYDLPPSHALQPSRKTGV